jgi:hypothetical protein
VSSGYTWPTVSLLRRSSSLYLSIYLPKKERKKERKERKEKKRKERKEKKERKEGMKEKNAKERH